jgi:hypothetical protein
MNITIEVKGEQRQYELGDDALKALQAIAARNGVSLEEALVQAIATEKFIEDQERSGAKLLIKKDDTLRELVRTTA